MTKVDGKFMIATEDRPLVNEDVWYRFKFDSGTVQNEAIRLKGKVVRIKKYGWKNTLLLPVRECGEDRRSEAASFAENIVVSGKADTQFPQASN